MNNSDHQDQDEDIIAVAIWVSGHVQGVFFRASTLEQAQRMSLKGTVENCADGRVKVEAEGSRTNIEDLVRYLHHGSDAAKVETVDVETIELDPQRRSFVIRSAR